LKFGDFSAQISKKFVYYNENMNPNSNFKHSYLEKYNDSEVVIKTKNAPFFMIFPNIGFFPKWTSPLITDLVELTFSLKMPSSSPFVYWAQDKDSLFFRVDIRDAQVKFFFKQEI
jgi:hypothetical protein